MFVVEFEMSVEHAIFLFEDSSCSLQLEYSQCTVSLSLRPTTDWTAL